MYVFRERSVSAFKEEASREKMVGKLDQSTGPSDVNLDFDHSDTPTESDDQGQAALMDTRMKCKKCFVIFIYLIWLVAIAISVLVVIIVGEKEIGVDFIDSEFVDLEDDQAWQLVSVWYLAIFGFGWLGLNELRIILVSLLAPGHARGIFLKEQKTKQENISFTPTGEIEKPPRGCSCLTCLLIPPQSVEISLDALYMIDVKANPGQYDTNPVTTKGGKKDMELA